MFCGIIGTSVERRSADLNLTNKNRTGLFTGRRMKLLIIFGLIAATAAQFGLPIPKIPLVPKTISKIASAATPSFSNVLTQTKDIAKLPAEQFEKAVGNVFNTFKENSYKSYDSPAAEQLGQKIFGNNIKAVEGFNEAVASGAKSFLQKLNRYADLTVEEFNKLVNGFNALKARIPLPGRKPFEPTKETVPDSIDWREKGAVSSVKSQALCAGCYAFSAAGALEGQYYKKSGALKEISVQNLIDCTQKQGNNGCLGGLMDPAFEYITDNKGVSADTAYPYTAKDGQCSYKSDNSAGAAKGFVSIPEGDEKALKQAVGTIGPVSAAIDASLQSMQFYSSGIYHDPQCKNKMEDMNHAILIVGYGTEDGQDYWLIKNSYGKDWGMDGYLKLARNKNNHCGIANIASYPLI